MQIYTVLTSKTISVAGANFLQYSPQPIGCPAFAAAEVPTTFADAPIGVAEPPTSVPIARDQASVASNGSLPADRSLMIGTIVAAKGMLSTNALAMPDTQIIMATMR